MAYQVITTEHRATPASRQNNRPGITRSSMSYHLFHYPSYLKYNSVYVAVPLPVFFKETDHWIKSSHAVSIFATWDGHPFNTSFSASIMNSRNPPLQLTQYVNPKNGIEAGLLQRSEETASTTSLISSPSSDHSRSSMRLGLDFVTGVELPAQTRDQTHTARSQQPGQTPDYNVWL
ncbi:hypothetical protein RRG08_007787 [Elysia crispata]|uniref:Uncharacterized protein n=1 Tax=Elysia crispata TaxID=231223 RepID=A0AAE1B3N6_9GAST|nr:hypothetical protein RRG08_007787 [Elysia crispata]